MKTTIEINPAINISDFKFNKDKEYLNKILKPPAEKFILKINYPLSNPYEAEVKTSPDGLSARKLIDIICKTYKKIYKEEDEGKKKKVGTTPGTYNRAKTEGKHGIWGHYLEELYLEYVYINDENITVGVGS